MSIELADLPEDVAEAYRVRAELVGSPLEEYLRDQLIAQIRRRREKTEAMTAVQEVLDRQEGPGPSTEWIVDTIREIRGD
ncbi:hypothetical protein [Pseudonocardia acaciae]|uniref:hypothetical protein n=1 Tax=Pseudonocardia acaciae TaxID=551276 RepID=UPI00048EFD5F|nr:hypothetical protein [Pseudonocardia acaciae]